MHFPINYFDMRNLKLFIGKGNVICLSDDKRRRVGFSSVKTTLIGYDHARRFLINRMMFCLFVYVVQDLPLELQAFVRAAHENLFRKIDFGMDRMRYLRKIYVSPSLLLPLIKKTRANFAPLWFDKMVVKTQNAKEWKRYFNRDTIFYLTMRKRTYVSLWSKWKKFAKMTIDTFVVWCQICDCDWRLQSKSARRMLWLWEC